MPEEHLNARSNCINRSFGNGSPFKAILIRIGKGKSALNASSQSCTAVWLFEIAANCDLVIKQTFISTCTKHVVPDFFLEETSK